MTPMNTNNNPERLSPAAGSVSDTPRTDEVMRNYDAARAIMLESLAKGLERELNDANEQLHKVCIRCSEWAEVAGKHGLELDRLRALLTSQNSTVLPQK